MVETDKIVAAAQITGNRSGQEDAFGFADLRGEQQHLCLVLADGMGGHAGGGEAAQCAVRSALETIGGRSQPLRPLLGPALEGANQALEKLIKGNRKLNGAGCTLVIAAIDGPALSWISVGDSSLLLLRDGELRRLNEDHSMRPVWAALVEAGRMTRADVKKNPNRGALRSALTGEEPALIDFSDEALPLKEGDQILLASDGMDTLDYAAMADLLTAQASASPASAVHALLDAVAEAKSPHQDNASVLLYRHCSK